MRTPDLVAQLSFASPEALRAAFETAQEGAPPPAPGAGVARASRERRTVRATGRAGRARAGGAPRAPPRRKSAAKVHFGGDIEVAEDGIVTNPVVAIGGSVTVLGRVEDDVVAIGGNVHLGPKAEVSGSVTSVGGRIEQERGANVRGEIQEIGVAGPIRFGPSHWWAMGHDIFSGWFHLSGRFSESRSCSCSRSSSPSRLSIPSNTSPAGPATSRG